MEINQKELEFLKEITDLNGTSGDEGNVRKFLKQNYEKITNQIEYDGMGSILATHGTSGPRILAVGHMDEVGFMVRAITNDGYIKFMRCGYFFIQGVLNQHFTIITEKGNVHAICGAGPEFRRNEFPDVLDLVMDVGCKSKEEVEKLGIQVGDFIVPQANFQQMGNDNKYLVNKAWDNRIGCAVSLRVMEQIDKEGHPNIFIGGGSVQEEVGTRGAKTLGYMSNADIGFSIDVGICDDMPMGQHESIVLGGGPELCVMDSGVISNRKLLKFVVKVAEECGIPYQLSILKHGGTDAQEFQGVKAGMPVLLVNVPSRYAHTPNSMIYYDDYINTIKLMSEVVKRLDEETVKYIRSFD